MRIVVTVFMTSAFLLFWGCGKMNSPADDDTVTPVARMVCLKGGTFLMGSPTDFAYQGKHIEVPVHSVTLSAFYMDMTEVTQADYQSLMGLNPSFLLGDSLRPVETVNWFDAVLYCNARSKRDSLDTVYSYSDVSGTPGDGCDSLENLSIDMSKKGYRLPTEAEWEYACRAGTATDYFWGRNYPPVTLDDTLAINAHAVWSNVYSIDSMTHRVGSKLPNAWGLYDMAGNVWEWCNDWYDVNNYPSTPQTDPTGPSAGSARILRGGSFDHNCFFLRSAYRNEYFGAPVNRNVSIGFRAVLPSR
jgi:formylglycine-generating enzyme required for sulfatase activity